MVNNNRQTPIYLHKTSIAGLVLSLLILCFHLCPSSAKELDGRVSETNSFSTTSTQDKTLPNDNNQLPSWFGKGEPDSQQGQSYSNPIKSPLDQSESQLTSTTQVNLNSNISQDYIKAQIARLENQIGKGSEYVNSQTSDHPDWIPANAYTNENMIMNYFLDLPWLRFGQPISPGGQNVRLLKSITSYWRTGRYGNCETYFSPISGHPGNFTFFTVNNINGPHGWVQDTGQRQHGTHLYRIWFDQ